MEAMKRGNFSQYTFLLLLVSLFFASASAGDISGRSLEWIPGRSTCRGTIAECIGGDEFDLSSETRRRVLQASTGYISYDALGRGRVPCSRRGASYYNCQEGAEANPYTPGCEKITLCRGN